MISGFIMAVDTNYFSLPCPVPSIISIFVNVLIFVSITVNRSLCNML